MRERFSFRELGSLKFLYLYSLGPKLPIVPTGPGQAQHNGTSTVIRLESGAITEFNNIEIQLFSVCHLNVAFRTLINNLPEDLKPLTHAQSF